MTNLLLQSTPIQHKTGNDETKEQNLLDKIAGDAQNDEMKAMAAEMAAKSMGAILTGARKRKEREEKEKDGDGEEGSEGSQGGKNEKGDGETEDSGNGEESKKKGKGKGEGKTPGAARACKGRAEMAQFAAVSEALQGFRKEEARRMNKWQKRREQREEEWRQEQREQWERMCRDDQQFNQQLVGLLGRLVDKIPDQNHHVGVEEVGKEHEE